MKRVIACLVLLACGGKQQPSSNHMPVIDERDAGRQDSTETPLEKRRDTACEVVAKRVTACAVEDSKRDLAAGKVTKEQFDKDTSSQVVAKNAEEYASKCKAHSEYSSRQVRVLEKCPDYESECEPFLKCLDNIQPHDK